MIDTDVFTIEPQKDGSWWILKNGDFFLSCASRQAAEEIVKMLRKDAGLDVPP